MSTIPDIAGRDLCGGGSLPRKVERVEADSIYETTVTNNERPSLDPEFAKRLLADERNLSDQARDLVNGARQEAYGEPQDNLSRIGVAWSSIFGCEPISAYKVALAMTALKLVRAAHRGDEDSIRDAFGYLHLAEEFRP